LKLKIQEKFLSLVYLISLKEIQHEQISIGGNRLKKPIDQIVHGNIEELKHLQ